MPHRRLKVNCLDHQSTLSLIPINLAILLSLLDLSMLFSPVHFYDRHAILIPHIKHLYLLDILMLIEKYPAEFGLMIEFRAMNMLLCPHTIDKQFADGDFCIPAMATRKMSWFLFSLRVFFLFFSFRMCAVLFFESQQIFQSFIRFHFSLCCLPTLNSTWSGTTIKQIVVGPRHFHFSISILLLL